MKHPLLALGLLCSLAAMGCAASGEEETDGGFLVDGGVKTDGAAADSGKKDSGSTTGSCVPTCSTDQDCQNSCPSVPNGINCCDTSTGICYAYASQTCPAPIQDAGFD